MIITRRRSKLNPFALAHLKSFKEIPDDAVFGMVTGSFYNLREFLKLQFQLEDVEVFYASSLVNIHNLDVDEVICDEGDDTDWDKLVYGNIKFNYRGNAETLEMLFNGTPVRFY